MSNKDIRKTLLVILLDAFSKTYFSEKHTPFLYEIAQEGALGNIEPLFAFKGIETTIFTGVWPSVHNVWTEFCFLDEKNCRKNDLLAKNVLKVVDFLPLGDAKAKFRYAIEKFIFQESHSTPSLIPPDATTYFQASQQKEITEPGAVGEIKTVFDVFRKKGVRYVFIEPWIWGDAGVFRKAKNFIEKGYRFDFWYVKFNLLDHVGHKFGPSPFLFSQELKKIDTYVKDIVTLLTRKNPNLNVLILADHGMSKVHNTVDILSGLNQLKSKMYKDYIAFADSTMIRFWPFTEDAKQEIVNHLRRIKYGHVLSISEKKCLKMSLDLKYGETIYALDEGSIIHPCFFHTSLVNGMHGYAYPKTPEALPIMLMNDQLVKEHPTDQKYTYKDVSSLIMNSLLPNFSG